MVKLWIQVILTFAVGGAILGTIIQLFEKDPFEIRYVAIMTIVLGVVGFIVCVAQLGGNDDK